MSYSKIRIFGGLKRSIHSQSAQRFPQTVTHGEEVSHKVKVRQETANQKPPPLSIPDFEDHKEAYRSKSWLQLFRGFVVFKLCSFDVLVDRQLTILTWCRRLLGRRLFVACMRGTLYGHFMGGERKQEVIATVQHNLKYGVLPMIAFTASESHGDTDRSDGDSDTMLRFYADCVSAVTDSLQYANEMKGLSHAVPLVSSKPTFIKPHHTFKSTSTMICQNREFISSSLQKQGGNSETVDFNDMIRKILQHQNNLSSLHSALMSMDFHLKVYQEGCKQFPTYKDFVKTTNVDVDGIKSTADILNSLGQRAEELGVVLIWDAEQTYLQSAIDVFILDSMRTHNRDRAVVHGTYQCYLKETFDKVKRDMGLAEQEGFCWGGKIVRGAYMDEERSLASQHGYEDPVNPSYEATTEMYHTVVSHILSLMTQREAGAINVTVATHNVDTVRHIINRMMKMQFKPTNNFRFAQLLGMRDNITFSLGQHGVPVAKLVHYGPVEDCVAYLSRRVKENRRGIATANYERHMLGKEIRARMMRK